MIRDILVLSMGPITKQDVVKGMAEKMHATLNIVGIVFNLLPCPVFNDRSCPQGLTEFILAMHVFFRVAVATGTVGIRQGEDFLVRNRMRDSGHEARSLVSV